MIDFAIYTTLAIFILWLSYFIFATIIAYFSDELGYMFNTDYHCLPSYYKVAVQPPVMVLNLFNKLLKKIIN